MASSLLGKFVAYQKALGVVGAVENAVGGWKGWSPLVDQVRRASSSVVLNLAEGNGHDPGSKERRRFQRIALGSALEVEGALDVAAAAHLGDPDALAAARALSSESIALLLRLTDA